MARIPVRHINPSGPEPGDTFNIRDVHEVLEGTDMVQPLHRHDFFFLLALEKGTGKHQIDFTDYDITDFSIFVLRPGQVHQLVLKAGSSGYLIAFKREFYNGNEKMANQRLRKMANRNHYRLDRDAFEKMMPIFAHCFREYKDKEEGYEDVIKANMNIFFVKLLRHSKFHQGTSNSQKPYEEERLHQFTELLDAQLSAHKEVSYYSEMLNLSTYQLNAITKSLAGKTASEMINERIILEARRDLLATSDQVNQIGYRLGYDDPSYFTRFFRKHTGYSPEAFRNNFK